MQRFHASRLLKKVIVGGGLLLVVGAGCRLLSRDPGVTRNGLEWIASSPLQWTGVAVSDEKRIFVNFPRWADALPMSVGEIHIEGQAVPYPDREWNTWTGTQDPGSHFICVQSVVIDKQKRLWVLDPANPRFAGVVPGGPKLVMIDLETDRVARVYTFTDSTVPANGYLNDLRVDTARQFAYITDSGAGALIVVDLASGESRRVLAGHPLVCSEGTPITINGRTWRRPDGRLPDVHADGIALSPDGTQLYFQALTGNHLYRVPTAALRDKSLSDADLAKQVTLVGRSGPADGLLCTPNGAVLLSSIRLNAVRLIRDDGSIKTVVQDGRLRWPDSFAAGPDGYVYVTTSQIHLQPDPDEPYGLLRFKSP